MLFLFITTLSYIKLRTHNQTSIMIQITEITSSLAAFRNYITSLNLFLKTSPPVCTTIQYARTLCDGLPSEEEVYKQFNCYGARDKGNLGKILEFSLFGQKPNCDACPDLEKLGIDLKVTKLKTMKNKNMNAKERLTITNVGNPEKENFGKEIIDHENLADTKYYSKVRRGLAIIVENGSGTKYKTIDDVMNMRVLYFMSYDIENLPQDFTHQLHEDYTNIRQRIIEGNISQRGQKSLHIHPHGSKGSKTRALGFTNKFLTRMLGHYISVEKNIPIEDVLVQKGSSISIKPAAFN